MDNELLPEPKLWQSRRFYIVTGITIIVITGIAVFISGLDVSSYAWGYKEKPVFEKALEAVANNNRAVQLLGTPEPMGTMAIAEGEVAFVKDSGFTATITIKGSKGKGKMDIGVHKHSGAWVYDYINVRIRKPKEVITIQNPEPITINKATP